MATFLVADLASEVARLTKRGVTFSQGLTRTPGSSVAILEDASGNRGQLPQRGRAME